MNILRISFQILAFGIFLFQMQNSFKKYCQGPVVQERYLTSKYVTKQPIFFVCQVDQFNYTTAVANGYSGHINWAKGKLVDSEKISWKGKDGNISFDQLFDSDYSSFKSVFGEINSTFPPCIWLLRGFCLELYPYCLFRGHGIIFFF